MRKGQKGAKGITLVALIITIIVLLILAIVSIRLVINDGIIEKAEKGTKDYLEAEIVEQIKLAYFEWELARWDGTAGDATAFVKARLLSTYGENLDQSSVKVENGKVTAKINGKTYEYNTATGKAEEIKPQAIGTITKDNYGDYIDLGQNVVGTSATTDDWRILYNDKAGFVYAILADYLPNNNAAVSSAGFTNNEKSGTYNFYSSTSRDDLLGKLNSTTAWQSLIPEGLRSTCQVKGATTAEIIMASYNEKYGTSLDYTGNTFLDIDADSSKGVDTLYMPHPGDRDYNGCWGYWMASPYAGDNGGVWIVDCSGGVYRIIYDYSDLGGCPVVSLPSDIQVTKNGTVWTVVQ